MQQKPKYIYFIYLFRYISIFVIYLSISDFFPTVLAQIGQKRKISYFLEVLYNIVITFPCFSGTLNLLLRLKGFFLGGTAVGGEDKPKIILIFSPSYKNIKQLLFKHDLTWLWAVNGSQAAWLAAQQTSRDHSLFQSFILYHGISEQWIQMVCSSRLQYTQLLCLDLSGL